MSESSQIIFQAPEIDQLAPFFPAYQIECLIATGGMGAVYRAVQKSLDRTVASSVRTQSSARALKPKPKAWRDSITRTSSASTTSAR
jgi:hypothetical protein